MKYKTLRRRVLILLLFVLIGIAALLMTYNDRTNLRRPDLQGRHMSGMKLLLDVYDGHTTFILLLAFLLSIPFVNNYAHQRENVTHSSYLQITRIGWKRYFWNCMEESVKDIWYIPVVINLVNAVITHVFLLHIYGSDVDLAYFHPLTYDPFTSWLLFTFCQIIGWSILNCFTFPLSQMIKNRFLYPFLLMAYCIIPIYIGTFLTWIFSVMTGVSITSGMDWVNLINPLQLLAPGMISIVPQPWGCEKINVVAICFLVQILVLALFTRFVYKRKVKYG